MAFQVARNANSASVQAASLLAGLTVLTLALGVGGCTAQASESSRSRSTLATAAAPELGTSGNMDAGATELQFPLGLAVDARDRLYVAERRGHRVVRFDPATSILDIVAGTGQAGFSGDGRDATQARLNCPDWVDLDRAGNLFIADRCNERIRRVDAVSGVITTVAGSGERGPAPDGPAHTVALTGPFYLNVESDESILFTDTDAHMIRRLNLSEGTITTLAGSGVEGFAGDGGPALQAAFTRPHVVMRTSAGELVIGDSFNQRIRVVDATGRVRTIAGNGAQGAAEEGALAMEVPMSFFGEFIEEPNGDLLFTEWGNGRILRLSRGSGRLHVVAPHGTEFGGLAGMAADSQGRLLVTEAREGRLLRIDRETGGFEVLYPRPGGR